MSISTRLTFFTAVLLGIQLLSLVFWVSAVTGYVEQPVDGSLPNAEEISSYMMNAAFFLVFFIAVSSVGFIFLMKFSISQSFDDFIGRLRSLQINQNLNTRFDTTGPEEFSVMATSLNDVLEGFQETMDNIKNNVKMLKDAHEQSSSTLDKAQHSANDQQKATEAVVASINSISSTMEDVATFSNDASVAASEANEAADNGSKMVAQTVTIIEQLSQNVKQANDAINRVSLDSSNIGTVLDVIRGISEQTNLLALNAAIEAARAGEAGRGFAVVADEVRTLAQRTQESTQEIQEMIQRLQEGTSHTVQVMETGVGNASQAVVQVNTAGDSLRKIISAVDGIANINQKISDVIKDQSSSAVQINTNISKITEAADLNMSGAKDVQEAYAQQSSLSNAIAEKVGRYTL